MEQEELIKNQEKWINNALQITESANDCWSMVMKPTEQALTQLFDREGFGNLIENITLESIRNFPTNEDEILGKQIAVLKYIKLAHTLVVNNIIEISKLQDFLVNPNTEEYTKALRELHVDTIGEITNLFNATQCYEQAAWARKIRTIKKEELLSTGIW